MILAASLKKLLDAAKIAYRIFPVGEIATDKILQSQVLVDARGLLLVVYPAGTRIDLQNLELVLKRRLTPLAPIQINRIFKDCDPGSWPPIGQAYNLDMIIDAQIKQQAQVHVVSGSNNAVLQLNLADFLSINSRAKILSCTLADPHAIANSSEQQLQQDTPLPSFAHFSQIIVTSTSNSEYWQHARYAAAYAQAITALVDANHKLNPQLSYAAGLLHNVGLLLFSQLFAPEYKLLRKWMQTDPKTPITVLEQRLLGMGSAFKILRQGHAQFGANLLQSWQAPEMIAVVAREHHNLSYHGAYAPYVQIIQLTNHLLRVQGIGDGNIIEISSQLSRLGLDLEAVQSSIDGLAPANVESTDIRAIIADCIKL